MNEAKFSQGPWKVNETYKGWDIEFSDDCECIVDHVYEEADAHLIAAAPEMYGELDRSIDQLDAILMHTDCIEIRDELTAIIKRQRALLAKARGEV